MVSMIHLCDCFSRPNEGLNSNACIVPWWRAEIAANTIPGGPQSSTATVGGEARGGGRHWATLMEGGSDCELGA